jgi:hypothetical protein
VLHAGWVLVLSDTRTVKARIRAPWRGCTRRR